MNPSVTLRRHPALAVFLFVVLLTVFQFGWRLISPPPASHPILLEIEFKGWKTGDLVVYWDAGSGFSESSSQVIGVPATQDYLLVRFVLRTSRWEKIRLDAPHFPGPFSIRSIRLKGGRYAEVWRGADLERILLPANDIEVVGWDREDGAAAFRAVDWDPYFELDIPVPSFGGWTPSGVLHLALLSFLPLPAVGLLLILGRYVLLDLRFLLKEDGVFRAGHRWGLGVAFVFVACLVFGLARQVEEVPVPQSRAGHNLYLHLADAISHGQLHLLEEPSKALMDLENPFDPRFNAQARLHDASLYNDRYYLYFGPAPVLFAHLPWKILTGGDLPDRWAAAFFLVGGFGFFLMIALRWSALSARSILPVSLIAGTLLMGLTTGLLFVVARSVVYEVAVASAFFWMAASAYLLDRIFRSEGPVSFGNLLLAGISLGMAMASRHSYVIGVGFLVFVALVGLALRRRTWKVWMVRASILVLPVFLTGVLLLVHNQVRFDDPFEFGNSYQIGIVDPQETRFMDPANFWFNGFNYFLQPPVFDREYPFLSINELPVYPGAAPPHSLGGEGVVGLLITNPYLFLFPFLLAGVFRSRSPDRYFPAVPFVLGILNFSILGFFSYASYRYQLDFLPWWVLAFCLLWIRWESLAPGGPRRLAVRIGFLSLFVWSASVHFLLAVDRLAT